MTTNADAGTMIWLQYVPHHKILLYLAEGWSISDELHGTPHGHYSVLMQYDGDGDPPQPER